METPDQRGAGEYLPKSVSCSAPVAGEPERRLAAGFAGNEHPKPVTDRRSAHSAVHVPADPQLRARLDAIYTPLETAVAELHDRRRRFAGRTPGRDWLPPDFPADQRGAAFLFRYIATPNFETKRFLQLANECGLLPVITEFHHDKYAPCNPIKRALVRLGFVAEKKPDSRPESLSEHIKISERFLIRPLCDIQTLWGQSLITFHNEFLAHALNGNTHPFVFNSSPQYLRAGSVSSVYYRDFLLRLCLADGILFEDFLLDETELPFTRDVVLPAFDAVTTAHGLKPLIVRLTSPEEEASPHWYWYPGELKSFVQKRLKP